MHRVDGYVGEMEYVQGFYREMAPASLNFVLLMQGVEPVPLHHGFSHFDLGCGHGVSTNVFAACHPEGDFHGLDFNPAHIAGAREAASEGKLANATFWEATFADLATLPLPEFDFITLHGVYSWVNQENREHILRFIGRKLKPGGVVYVSYNCLPGWGAFAPVRQLMFSCADSSEGPLEQRINESLHFISRLKETGLSYFSENPAAAAFFDYVGTFPRNYLAHEFYNRDWTLFYHRDVVADFARHDLVFAGSASQADNIDFLRFSPEEQTIVKGMTDQVLMETVKDFCTNQRFRKDVFIGRRRRLSPGEQRQLLGSQSFGLSLPNGLIDRKAKFPRGEATFDPRLYEPVLAEMEKRHLQLDEMMGSAEIAPLGEEKVFQVLAVLAAAGYAVPVVPLREASFASSRLFNASLLERSVRAPELRYLASPAMQNAIGLTQVQRLLLLGHLAGSPDPASLVRGVLPGQTDLDAQANDFARLHVPLLRQLGIL